MKIVGCDLHTRYQQVAMLDQETGELIERRLEHESGEARAFYAGLSSPVRVGIEATGHTRWFERMLAELGHELWIGDAAQIRAMVVRQQKTDRRDAEHLLKLLLEGRFPRLWVPSAEERDARQLLVHRHQRVRMRTQVKNQLQALALNQGLQRKRKLWSKVGRQELEKLELLPFAARRRAELLETLDRLEDQISDLDQTVMAEAQRRPEAVRLMTHPGVGPNTALGMVLTLGPVERFRTAKQVSSYLGLIPREHSSGGRQRLGHISKQGNSLMRFLLVEAGQTAARRDEGLRRRYLRWSLRIGRSKAKVAVARTLATRLYWMLRQGKCYAQQ
jgi:transposase